jgi:tetratricopeptide (TPR) repeat protein
MGSTTSGSKWKAPLLLLALTGAGCGSETERLFAEAVRAEGVDDYEGAAHRLREIVIGHPESPLAPQALFELAQIHLLRTRDVSAATAALSELLDEYPESDAALSAHGLLGRIYERQLDDPARAILHYRAALEGRESDVDATRETLLSLGECFYRLSELEEAKAAYQEAVALPYDESSHAAYLRLSTISRLSGDHQASLKWHEALRSRTRDRARRYTALEARLDSVATEGESEDIEKLQEKIRWSAGRARRGR